MSHSGYPDVEALCRLIRATSNAECPRLADAGDPEQMQEFALRVAAGVGLLATNNIATAHAHLIWCTGLFFGAEGHSIRLSDCMRAGTHAELAAKMGLGTAPAVIMLGRTLHRFRHGEHKETPGKWTDFWAAVDTCPAEVQAELHKEDAKRFVRPSRYKCAAPGFPVEASKGSAGKCEDAYKPRYCTKECQVADGKTHKRMCKPGLEAPQSEAPLPSRSPMNPSFTVGRFEMSPDWSLPTQSKNPTFKTVRNREYSVEIGGINVHSYPRRGYYRRVSKQRTEIRLDEEAISR
ncbi:hypothetical protein B0H14DRAFT_2578324 [Mycena olivaceomarginata]|nr:hypothetical protein B0H14DRAFT_2578324 [Mycena olivaceomarginata]